MAKDRFLAQGVTSTKRQRNGKVTKGGNKNPKKSNKDEEESDIGDIEDLEHRYETETDEASSEDEFLETAAEKRLRVAKDYIDKVKGTLETEEYDAAEIDRDLIAERLMTDVQERSGKWSRRIAMNFSYVIEKPTLILKGHKLPVTCVAISPNATGGRDRRIHIWSIKEDKHLAVFHQHKDAVTGLVFRRNVNQLYSCSADRMVKLWNIDELGYMDTLFGHQDGILSIVALQREQAVTVGGRDKTVRLWKIADENQLVFRAGSSTDQHRITKALLDENHIDQNISNSRLREEKTVSINRNAIAENDFKQYNAMLRALARDDREFAEDCVDCVTMIDEETYVTGGDSGALSLWSVQKKKPVYIHHVSHGVHPNPVILQTADDSHENEEVSAVPARPHWITALAAVPFTDLFFSASSDGWIRMWQLRPGKTPGFDLLNVIPVAGYVNGLSVCELPGEDPMSTKRNIVVAAAVGQEPRLGRWEKQKVRNVVKVFQLPSTSPTKKATV
ncbi:pre-rRNA processing protein [Coemansia sp. RSA 1365]|nr:pre-rRNA processing protein [Coemansia sp. RSA 1365]